jgi:hypothetical protein
MECPDPIDALGDGTSDPRLSDHKDDEALPG